MVKRMLVVDVEQGETEEQAVQREAEVAATRASGATDPGGAPELTVEFDEFDAVAVSAATALSRDAEPADATTGAAGATEPPTHSAAGHAVWGSEPGAGELIKLDRIKVAEQPRRTFTNIPELAASILAVGLIDALKVRPSGDGYELVEGERRLRALRLNAEKHGGQDFARCEVRILSDREADELRMVANLQREGFTPLEEATGYATMRDKHGMSTAEIGQCFGVGERTVYDRLTLLGLSPEAKAAVESEEMTVSVAVLVARRPTHKEQARAVARLKEQNITTHEAADELLRREFGYELKKAPFDREDPLLVSAAGECSKCPHNSRNQRSAGGKAPTADVCTNSGCYAQKVEAHVAKEKEKAAEAGKRWLPAAEAKAAFQGADDVPAASPYVDLDAICYEDTKKKRTWRQLLPKDAMPTLFAARNSRGEVKTLAKKADAVAAAREAGTLGEKAAEVAGRDKRAERKAVEEEGELLEAVAEKILAAGVEEASKGLSPLLMRALLAPMLEACDSREALETRRHATVEHLQKDLAKMKEADLRGLLFEVCFGGYAAALGPPALAMAKVLGLDRKKLEKEARAERQKALDLEAAEDLMVGSKAEKKGKAKASKKATT
jgi:ParB family chromosome partitioning protein